MLTERCYCINLDRRQDRYKEFVAGLPKDWPFPPPTRFRAIDGRWIPPPGWFAAEGGRRGAWGCYMSHVRIIEELLHDNVESALILEDDATFVEDFSERAKAFFASLPDDWEMAYIGGQLLFVDLRPPKLINPHVLRVFNVNRTHGFAVRGRGFLVKLYHHLTSWENWSPGHHIDHHLGKLHGRAHCRVYAPPKWLCGQNDSYSDINKEEHETRFWGSPITRAVTDGQQQINEFGPDNDAMAFEGGGPLFLGVMGLHSSGSSALAGLLYHLGLHLGNNLGGYWGKDPKKNCGFEAQGLAKLCERAIPFPACEFKAQARHVRKELRQWITGRQGEAEEANTIAAGKYPMLCQMGPMLWNIVGDNLRILSIERPINESIESLCRREVERHPPQAIADHQAWLEKGRRQFLSAFPRKWQLAVTYDELLYQTEQTALRICHWLNYQPTAQALANAINYVSPERRHVRHPPEATPAVS